MMMEMIEKMLEKHRKIVEQEKRIDDEFVKLDRLHKEFCEIADRYFEKYNVKPRYSFYYDEIWIAIDDSELNEPKKRTIQNELKADMEYLDKTINFIIW